VFSQKDRLDRGGEQADQLLHLAHIFEMENAILDSGDTGRVNNIVRQSSVFRTPVTPFGSVAGRPAPAT
jgi:hypothetical protein